MQTLLHACLDLLYPRRCLHCDASLPPEHRQLCPSCWAELEFSNPEQHCKSCYSPIENALDRCPHCKRFSSPFYRVISAFDAIGPSIKLRGMFQELPGAFLTKGAAALMAYRYLELHLPHPDLVIPLPTNSLTRIYKGISACEILAKELAILLGVPYQNTLFCRGWLEKEYKLKSETDLEDKCVLLIADLLTPAFFEAADALGEGSPRLIIGTTFVSGQTGRKLEA
jgi:predicted amidophosphoribosyltransferase